MRTDSEFLNGLTPQQKEAVTYSKGPLLVLAGPGAGKTKVLTLRIVYILNKMSKDKFKILALTFTNKAAKEMRERVELRVPEQIKRTYIGTFHSYCHDLLRAYGEYVGLNSDFVIFDNHEDLIALLIDAVKERVLKERQGKEAPILIEKYANTRIIENTIPGFYYTYRKFKNKLIGPQELGDKLLEGRYSEDFILIFKLYQQTLRKNNVLDFSDLLYYAVRLLKENPFVTDLQRRVYKHILIDEGQDTNRAQLELIKLLCNKKCPNLFIVADEDQLIFEWNDAKFEYLVELKEHYKMEVIQLYESFRCPQEILEIANNLINQNRFRLSGKEPIRATKGFLQANTKSVELNNFQTQSEEAEFVVSKIKELSHEINWIPIQQNNKFCVIARNRYILNEVMKKLEKEGIPYYAPMLQEKIISRDVNLLIDFLKLKVNRNNKISFYRICENLGLDCEDLVETSGITLFDIAIENLKNINAELAFVLEKVENGNLKDYLNQIFEVIKKQDSEEILEDIEFLESLYKNFKVQKKSNDLREFLNFLAMSSKREGKGVAILTGHASKGLEFDYVFIISLNQGVWPDYRAIRKAEKGDIRELEEERRNCFVAITRTKKKSFISYVDFKSTRSGLQQPVEPSQFLYEMGLLNLGKNVSF